MFTCSETEGGLICSPSSELVGTYDPGGWLKGNFEESNRLIFLGESDKCKWGGGCCCCWCCTNIGSCPKSEILDTSVSLWIAFVMSWITLV